MSIDDAILAVMPSEGKMISFAEIIAKTKIGKHEVAAALARMRREGVLERAGEYYWPAAASAIAADPYYQARHEAIHNRRSNVLNSESDEKPNPDVKEPP